MRMLKRSVGIILSLLMIMSLVGCSSSDKKNENTESKEEQTTVVSESEAINIAERTLKPVLNNNKLIQRWKFYKSSEIDTEDLIADKDNIIEVDMFVAYTAGLQGSIGKDSTIVYAAGVDKNTGEVIEKEPAIDWEEE